MLDVISRGAAGDTDIALINEDSSVEYVKLDGYAIIPKEIFKSDKRIEEIKTSLFEQL